MHSIPGHAPEPPAVSSSSFATIAKILPSVGISQQRFRQLESICLIREQRASGRQELAFNARPFVLCGLPLRRPPPNQLTHTRRNEKFFLQVIGHPQFGLLYAFRCFQQGVLPTNSAAANTAPTASSAAS
jgi:hypothetical protein